MKISHVVKTLVVSDFFINAGFSVFAPVFAVFVTKQIDGGTLAVVGFAAAIFQIFKSGLQIPIAKYLDKNHGEYDDFYSMVLGTSLIAIVPFLYLFATKSIHVYAIQALYGIGASFAIPPWYAIFSRHLDKMQENVEWSLDSIAIGIGAAASAALGGLLAERFGFQFVFILGGMLAIFGAVQQVRIFRDLKGKVSQGTVRPLPDGQK
jgi:DHA1 family quinolone resistance protein-like MFS transporter